MYIVSSVRAKCPPSPAMQRRSKITEILTTLCTLRLNPPFSIWAFGSCQEMICTEKRTPTIAGDLGLFQSCKRSPLECNALPERDQKLSLRRKSVFHTGVSCGLPKGRYLLPASVVFCAKFYLRPYKCCLSSIGRDCPCRNRTACHRMCCKFPWQVYIRNLNFLALDLKGVLFGQKADPEGFGGEGLCTSAV